MVDLMMGEYHMESRFDRKAILEMTRLEVFIDDAFAFAVTMMVISFDSIPRSHTEVMLAAKTIPAFVVAVTRLIWIWYTHNVWRTGEGMLPLPSLPAWVLPVC